MSLFAILAKLADGQLLGRSGKNLVGVDPSDLATPPPTATAAGQILVATGAGTDYVARARIMSGTLAARDVLAPVHNGDRWYVSSGASAGTFWERVNGVWNFIPTGVDAAEVLAALGGVALTGDQTIAGAKHFTGNVRIDDGLNMFSTTIINLGPPQGDNDAVARDFRVAVRFYARTVAQLAGIVPAAAEGDVVWVSNGRKPGEGAGVGTGVLARYNGAAWRSLLEDADVAA